MNATAASTPALCASRPEVWKTPIGPGAACHLAREAVEISELLGNRFGTASALELFGLARLPDAPLDAARILGGAEALRAELAMPVEARHSLSDTGGLDVMASTCRTGTVRFDSIDEFVRVEVEATPLIDRLSDDLYGHLRRVRATNCVPSKRPRGTSSCRSSGR